MLIKTPRSLGSKMEAVDDNSTPIAVEWKEELHIGGFVDINQKSRFTWAHMFLVSGSERQVSGSGRQVSGSGLQIGIWRKVSRRQVCG